MKYQINHQQYEKDALLNQAKTWRSAKDEWLSDLGSFIIEWFNDDKTIEVNTSGSTGQPKRIYLSKEAMKKSAEMTVAFLGLKPGMHALLCLPVKFIAGKMMVVRALTNGLNLLAVPPASNPLHELNERIDFAAFTPMQMDAMIKAEFERLSSIEKIIIGGAAIPGHIEEKIFLLPHQVYATYGMTETITHIALRKVIPGNDVYEALPGVVFEQNVSGCLVIDAPHLEEKVITQDVVEWIDETHFRFLGRKDNVINSGGIKLSPETIEAKMGKVIAHQFFCTKKTDDLLGEKLVLYIEQSEVEPNEVESLRIKLKAVLTSFEMPREIIFVHAFERTPTDKIIRKNYDL